MKKKSGKSCGKTAVILYGTVRVICGPTVRDVWHSPITGRNFPVDGEIRIRHVANGIMKQAGIDYHF
ncbi:hypothetical protein FACS189485_01940 [Spirochaetia bacterium]|nr:hypothetical protein FACS189485_01940 [Spirochaetia bacterium]